MTTGFKIDRRRGVQPVRRHRKAVLALALMIGVSFVTPVSLSVPAAAQSRTTAPANGFADLAERLLPAVVNISTTQIIRPDKGDKGDQGQSGPQGRRGPDIPQFPPGSPFEEFFKEWFDRQGRNSPDAAPRRMQSLGSGFIVDPSGYVVTNNHVIDDADEIRVTLHDNTQLTAKLVGRDTKTDIALLKVDSPKPLAAVKFGNSDTARVGDWVVAIGNPFGLGGTVTVGIVSARARDINAGPYDDFIQTDASINRGNSGGPMFNLAGEVIGMNSVIYAPTPGFAGIAFAIPSNSLRFCYGRLMKTGRIDAGMLPIHTQQVTWMLQQALSAPDLQGALVTSIQDDDGKMLEWKISPGDIIRTFNEETVRDPRDLARKAAWTPIGSKAVLGLYRAGETSSVEVTIRAWPQAKPVVLNNDAARTLGLELASGRDDQGRSIVTVASVDANGTAAASGIQQGDLIVEVQKTSVSEPDEALRILRAQSLQQRGFAAVLVEHDKKLLWMSIAIPQ